MKKSALYIRVSTHYQIDKDSLPFQKKELINYSKYILNIDEYEIFEDAGYSGKNTVRPAFQDMISRIKKGEFTHLLVWKIDRISRNLLDFCAMYEELKKYNCTFISKNEQFDTSSATGEAMLKLVLIFAELERKLTSERVSAIMLDRANKGLWNGAQCPLGYSWNEEKKFPDINKDESETIKLIYNTYENISSSLQVAKMLNSEHIKTKRDGKWSSKTVSDIIRNPFYKGTYRYNYRESARGKIKDESEWIIVEDNHSPIISKEQWEHCNKIMDINAQRNTSLYRKNSNIHVFASLIKCKKCGETFIANCDVTRKDGYRPSYYYCKGKYGSYGCDAKLISDVTLGPFIINYLANLLKAQKKLNKKNNLKDLEQFLLSGKTFVNIAGIDRANLESLYLSFLYSKTDNVLLKTKDKSKVIDLKSNLSVLTKEKEKYNRAFERLQSLYLFSDDAMSEKDFLVQKLKLTEKLDEVNKKIDLINEENSNTITYDDISFLKKTSNFMINNELMNKKFINFKTMVMTMDKQLIKGFINTIIDKIEIKNGKVVTIYFKNGIINNFIYKEKEC
ncbi:resolvase [Clostridium botulinum]|uniref:recombinase family protein n=1 Tax=Clostridium botulinum TaxID=1491 RepID=UPI000174E519|nr:recombinase family protein [Clostridium botulinum]ACD51100.1 putative resolvase [Clostridium botulinum E3 str. Alaska E43]AJF29720.1 resolvase [Clostridium botulinum]AJF32781.1 resolvase [Clostridium botulinum]MBY6949118.1 recombinase family protein [Clostridium botulinum]MBY7022762.1 recombinase family protein [Clostridium botulinum]